MAILKRLLALCALLGAGYVLYLQWQAESDAAPTAEMVDVEASQMAEPDVQGNNVTFRQFHPDGDLHYRLLAAGIRQFSDIQTTHLDNPDLHLRSPAQPPWDIQSRSGYIKREEVSGVAQDTVFLNNQVELVQQHPTNGTLTLRSNSFYLYPARQYAVTNEDVTIDTEVGRTQAGGLTIDLDTGILNLNSSATQRVHTIVLPEQFKDA